MSLYIKLDKGINAKQLLQKIEHQINEHRKNNTIEDSILCIDIKPIANVVDSLVRIELNKQLENTYDRKDEMSE